MRRRPRQPLRIVIRSHAMLRLGSNVLLAALFLAAFFAADPGDSEWGLKAFAPVKYFPVLLAFLATPLLLLGAKGYPWREPALLSAIAFLLLVLGGGATTVISGKVSLADSFIGRGLCALPLIPAYLVTFLPKERMHVAKRFAPALILACVMMLVILVLWRVGIRVVNLKHIYHEEAVYFAALAGAGLAHPTVRKRVAQVSLFSFASAMTIKLTGFAFAAVGMAALVLVELKRVRQAPLGVTAMRRLWIGIIVVGAVGFVAAAATLYRALLPSGSPGVRLLTYTERWELFLESPVWGQLFIGSPIMQAGALVLPSHSDFLDILAFGGLIAVFLFWYPCLAALRHGIARLPAYVNARSYLEPACVVFAAAFLFEQAFNPVLHQAKLVLLFWFAIGCLLADRRIQVERTMMERAPAMSRVPLAAQRGFGPPPRGEVAGIRSAG